MNFLIKSKKYSRVAHPAIVHVVVDLVIGHQVLLRGLETCEVCWLVARQLKRQLLVKRCEVDFYLRSIFEASSVFFLSCLVFNAHIIVKRQFRRLKHKRLAILDWVAAVNALILWVVEYSFLHKSKTAVSKKLMRQRSMLFLCLKIKLIRYLCLSLTWLLTWKS